MTNLLILYPDLFAAQPKFERKVRGLIRNMAEFGVVFLADPHQFIQQLQVLESKISGIVQVDRLENADITHAIVFDNGEEFTAERNWLESKAIPTRWIRIPITRVVNIKRETGYQNLKSDKDYEYIGRGSYWGNPHATFAEGDSREEVIRKYAYDFNFDKFINIDPKQVHALSGKRLGCFCKPAPCHGDVLADYLNSYDDGQ
jgi:hypothetical protein